MSQIDLELPREAVIPNVAVAGLAAVGLTALVPPSGGRDQALVVVPLLTLLLAAFLLVRTRRTVDRARREAGSATTTDPLTGLAPAAAGEQVLEMEFAAAQRERDRELTVVLIRLEGLGGYRAEHGRVVTEKLMKEAGRVLARHRRGMHLAARYTTEGTFLSVLSGVDRRGAAVYATRVRRELLRLSGVPRPARVSVGIAGYHMTMKSHGQLVRQAEFALRKGAATGGKVVVVQTPAGAA